MGKVRIYELARELKLESRKVIEDARRLGVDVSVASNTVDEVIADRIREQYYPKKEQAVSQRAVRLVKTHKPAPPPVEPTPKAEPVSREEPDGAMLAAKQQPVKEVAEAPQPVRAEPEAPAISPGPSKARIVKLKLPPLPVTSLAPEPQPSSEAAPEPAVVESPPPEEALPEPQVAKPAEPATGLGLGEEEALPPSTTTVAAPPGATKVIRLATPKPIRSATEEKEPPAHVVKAKEEKSGELEEVHLLPSGVPQRVTYIPPQDRRHKGRHSHRARGPQSEKFQEGHRDLRPPVLRPATRITRSFAPSELKPIRLVEGTTVRSFAEKLDLKPKDVVAVLLERGVMATINQTLNADVAQEVGRAFGYEVTFAPFEDVMIETEFEMTPEAMEDTDPRPPVVTVMGHVDHGKTSLLDAIRATRVAEGEAGGITQHIGAYSVAVTDPDHPGQKRRIVFLDTPGHEAFTRMRARGARVTDIVVLVVAADDGVMPQTIEAIEHAKAAEVPIVVAINKIDKPEANPERVKKELADRGLLWEGWGGSTTMVEVSAKKKQNIEALLEMILLTADLLELKANPRRRATGTVLEAKLDRGRGAVATVLVQNGTLRVGDPFIVGNYHGRVRALLDDRGEAIKEAGPATPVEVLGLEGVPEAGDQFQAVTDIAEAQRISELRQSQARAASLARTAARGLDHLAAQMESGGVKELLVILKADVQGSVEVLKETLSKLSTDRVKVRLIRSGVGAITESDVLLASASQATTSGTATVIIGFNVRPESRAEEVARQENVDIRLHSVIYKVEEEIRNAMIGMLEAQLKERLIGKAEIRNVIRVPKVGQVAGCMVVEGSVKRGAKARLIRDSIVLFESEIASLRRFKDDVSEVQQGFECGLTLERFSDYKVGDVIEIYLVEKVAPTRL
jgi:translation initiation factor IF-2